MRDEMVLVEYFEGSTCDWMRTEVSRGLVIEIDIDVLKEEIEEKLRALSSFVTWVGDAVMGLGPMLYVVPLEHVEEAIALLNKKEIPFSVYTLKTCRFIRLLSDVRATDA
jgi:cation transport regulator ChaC